MCIPFLRISSPHDFMKCISGKLSLWRKKLIARELFLPDKIKNVLSRAHMRSLGQRARNAHDQSEQTSKSLCLGTVNPGQNRLVMLRLLYGKTLFQRTRLLALTNTRDTSIKESIQCYMTLGGLTSLWAKLVPATASCNDYIIWGIIVGQKEPGVPIPGWSVNFEALWISS